MSHGGRNAVTGGIDRWKETTVTSDGGVRVLANVMVPMRDGARLKTDIYLPAGDGPFPVLVTRTPYSTDDGQMDWRGRDLARQGYATIVQFCRGRFGSEGEFHPHQSDVEDGYDTIEWAAAQPWSNGKVGMVGASYLGLVQWEAAMARPPHLVAIAPTSAAWSFFNSNVWYWKRGVIGLGMALMWTGQMTSWEAERRGIPQPLPVFAKIEQAMHDMATDPESFQKASIEQAILLRELLARRPLRDIEELREVAPWWRDWCDHDNPDDPYWRNVDASKRIADLQLPIMHTTGWYDFFTGGVLDGYIGMKAHGATEEVRRAQRLVVGPWSHVPGIIPRGDVAASSNPSDMYALDENSPTMKFFAHHLKGEQPGYDDTPPVKIFVMGANEWRDEWEWPLARTQWTGYFLHSGGSANTLDGDGSLSLEQPDAEPADSFLYDPTDPVPGPTAIGLAGFPEIDPINTGRRKDVLVYQTTVLEHDLEVTGPVTLELWAASSVPDTDFVAKLIDILPDGTAIPICQGMVRTRFEDVHPIRPGEPTRLKIEFWATSNVFAAGHRMRLHITSSEFPTYDLNPNTGKRITHDASAHYVVATQHVYHDQAHPSRLILPVIPR